VKEIDGINTESLGKTALDVVEERHRQETKFPGQTHPSGTGPGVCWTANETLPADVLCEQFRGRCERRHRAGEGTWADILLEEVAEVMEQDDPAKLRAELVQVAAVAFRWIQHIDTGKIEEAR
jgi:hypothetical protein